MATRLFWLRLRITLLFIVIVVGFGRQPGSSFTGHGPSRSARGDLGFLVLVDRNILKDLDVRGLFVSMQVSRGSMNS
ncbi:NADH-ubiquinone oxidoreductase subunit [Fusarium oxysporum f. sp. albedinis]|nr:NADH-ubiquinone oxidoreductase subunit [Fusarium oxysporum f. sp. albedinis]